MGALSALLLSLAGAAAADAPRTDFGVRVVGGTMSGPSEPAEGVRFRPLGGAPVGSGIGPVAAMASQWGRVTSTYRSPEHNRRVGGVANSFHLSGRAIDIARRPGVSHWQIDSALRRAGYQLVESLDEGDHSHFAFAFGGAPRTAGLAQGKAPTSSSSSGARTAWRIVAAPR